MKEFIFPHKLYDTQQVPRFGRVEKAWVRDIISNVFENKRKGPDLPGNFQKFDPDWIRKYFTIRGFEFGNWLSQEDRWNYFVGATVSLYDLADITGLSPQQMGLSGLLSLAFGARGSGRAIAHFEPRRVAINLTRYSREASKSKEDAEERFLIDGGIGALGHEWGHALDFYLGYFETKNPSSTWATNILFQRLHPAGENRYTLKDRSKLSNIESAFLDLMLAIMFEEQEKGVYRRSEYYDDMFQRVEKGGNKFGDYWIDPKEVFARAFEVFLTFEGKRKGIENPYLMKNKYIDPVYATEKQYRTWEKQMKRILGLAEDKIAELRLYEDYFRAA